MSSIRMLFLRLREGMLLLGEGLHLEEGCLHLGEPEASVFLMFPLRLGEGLLRLGEGLLRLGEVVLLGRLCFLDLFALFFSLFTFYSCKT